jgi:hypothetical protein
MFALATGQIELLHGKGVAGAADVGNRSGF